MAKKVGKLDVDKVSKDLDKLIEKATETEIPVSATEVKRSLIEGLGRAKSNLIHLGDLIERDMEDEGGKDEED